MDKPDMDKKDANGLSRRNFLKGIPLGIAGAITLNAFGGRLFGRGAAQYPKFPEGSIFTPADDRTDA